MLLVLGEVCWGLDKFFRARTSIFFSLRTSGLGLGQVLLVLVQASVFMFRTSVFSDSTSDFFRLRTSVLGLGQVFLVIGQFS